MSDKSPYKKGGMFEGASYLLFEKANKGINGYKFRRQHPINNYIADFFCFKAKLIVEIDGSIHHKNEIIENDFIRQKDLENLSYTIIGFSNFEIHNETEKVLNIISQKVNNIINSNTPKYGV
jgi:very-short-patch-repair endonuclease